jgi:hypothetical protein
MTDEKTFDGIQLDDKVVGVWFLKTTEKQDWMACLREVIPDDKYELTYRFRYYEDDKAFESEDRKSWYRAEVPGTRNYCIFALRSTGGSLEAASENGRLYEILNHGDYKAFIKELFDAPFVFVRQEKIQDGQ